MWRSVLKAIGWIALALVGSILTASFVIWIRPGLVLNGPMLDRAAATVRKRGIKLEWESRRLDAHSRSFWIKVVELDLRGACFEVGPAQGCFDEVSIHVEADLRWSGPCLTRIGPVRVIGKSLRYVQPPETVRSKAEKRPTEFPGIPRWLDRASVDSILVRTPFEVVLSDSRVVKGNADFHGDKLEKGVRWALSSDAVDRGAGHGERRAEVNVVAQNPVDAWSSHGWKGALDAQANERNGPGVDAALRVDSLEPGLVKANLKAGYRDAKKRRIDTVLAGTVRDDRADIDVNAKLAGLTPAFPLVDLERCPVALAWTPGSFRDARLSIENCRTWANYRELEEMVRRYRVRIDKRVGLVWKLRLDSFIDPSKERPLRANLGVDLDTLENDLVELKGHAEADVRSPSYAVTDATDVKGKADVRGDVKNYRTFAKFLSGNGILVLAPFHALDGGIHFGARAEGDWLREGFKVPFDVSTDLSSPEQRLYADAVGTFTMPARQTFGASPHLTLDLAFKDVKLVLPRLQLEVPPAILPDSRIRRASVSTSKTRKAKRPALTYDVRIHNVERPLLIVSNLLKDPVPLDVDLHLGSGEDLRGGVGIRDYALELFRRKATVEKFALSLSPDRTLDAKIRVEQPERTIHILILGTQDQPQIKFLSDPPLPDDEIVAALLFGEPLDQLDASGKSSASNLNAALARGTLGLASLYFLASTPIESIGYDPSTGQMSAQFRLGKATSLNLGVSSEQVESVGLTKRLGKHWRINTVVNNPADPEERSLSSFLEWFLNY